MVDEDNKDYGEVLVKWNFPEFEKPTRSKAWYIWAIIITLALIVYAIISVNFLFAVIIVLAAITLIIKYQREPEQITFTVFEDGIELENKFHLWETIKEFYIIYKPPQITNLFLNFKPVTKPRLVVPLQNQNPVEIRKVFSEFIDENLEKETEPFSEAVGKLFKL